MTVLTMSLTFRSNVNYIPPPQEVSVLFLFVYLKKKNPQSITGKKNPRLCYLYTNTRLCPPTASRLQTHAVVHALRSWPSFKRQ